MRRAERRPRDERPLRREQRHLEGLERDERRQDARQAPPQHRLARSGRPGEEEVVPARRRELERPPRPFLPADVGEVGTVRPLLLLRRLDRGRAQLAAEIGDGLGQMAHGDRVDPRERRLGGRLRSAEDPVEPGPPGALRHREGTAHGANATVEGELPDRRVLGQSLPRELPRRCEHRQGDREVEAGALLAQPCRREVDGDAPVERPLEQRRRDAAADAVLRLRAGAIGQSDDRESRDAALEVGLDLHAARLEADQSVGDGAREHTIDATREVRTPVCRFSD
jgi:hypothetical protein